MDPAAPRAPDSEVNVPLVIRPGATHGEMIRAGTRGPNP